MKIIIDADACPKGVKELCKIYAKKYNLELIMVIDTCHELSGDFKIIQVDKGQDSVDLEIVKISQSEDLIITQDYGLASILLKKVYGVLNPSGFRYTEFNIDSLMFQRYVGQKIRNSGGRTKGPKKRKQEDDKKFEQCLLELLKLKVR